MRGATSACASRLGRMESFQVQSEVSEENSTQGSILESLESVWVKPLNTILVNRTGISQLNLGLEFMPLAKSLPQ